MLLSEIAGVVGEFFDLDEGRAQAIGTAGWSPSYTTLRLPDGSVTCRQTVHLLPLLPKSKSTRRPTAMPAAAKSQPAKPAKAVKPAKTAKKTPLAIAKEGTDAELAEFLLAHQTYPDASWKDRAGKKSRRDKESRSDFIRRVLLGEEGAA